MLLGALVLYFLCLFVLQRYAKPELRLCRSFLAPILALSAAFVAAMLLLRETMRANIFITVVYAFLMFWRIYRFSRRNCKIKTE